MAPTSSLDVASRSYLSITPDREGTALVSAVTHRKPENAQLLLSHGADPRSITASIATKYELFQEKFDIAHALVRYSQQKCLDSVALTLLFATE